MKADLPPESEPRFVFRPRTGTIAFVAWAALTVLWLVLEARNGFGSMLRTLPLALAVLMGIWMVFGRPCVVVTSDGVQLRNVLRDVLMPFGALKELSTQYCLKLTDAAGRGYQAWAAPAPSRHSATRVTDQDLRALSLEEDDGSSGVPASATLRSDAGAAAVAVRRAWKKYLAGPAPSGPASPTVTWNLPLIGTFLGLVLVAVLAGLL